jgi:hypothetical protein
VSTTNTLFEEPWWLDAAAPGAWDAVEIEEGGRVVARLPFVAKRNRGITVLTQPSLTPTLGPWVEPSEGKYARRLELEKDRLAALIERLPPHHVFRQNFAPAVTNWLPFHWAGFSASVRYTYRLQDLSDPDAIWRDFSDSVRGHVRKAEKTIEVREGELEHFLALQAMTFGRQGLKPPSPALVRRLDEACRARGAGRLLSAVDADGNTHATIFLVWDDRCAYNLMAGRDDAFVRSGAMSLLLWEAIRFAAGVTKIFDFEGSMIEPIERFFRSFGGRQTPYLRVERDVGRAVGLRHARGLARWALRRSPAA